MVLGLATAPSTRADAQAAPTPGTRVSALSRAVRFAIPGSTARVTLAAGSSALVTPASGTDTPRVKLEEGIVHLEVPAGSPTLVRMMGTLHGLHVRSGHAVYMRRGMAGEESGLMLDGEAEVPTGAKSVPFPREQMLRASPAGSVLLGIEPAVMQAALEVSRLATVKDGTVVDLPAVAVPAPGKPAGAFVEGPIAGVPIAGGTTAASLTADRPTLATDQISELRQRLLVGVREEGFSGPGFMLDFVPVRAGRVRNVLMAGSRGFVRFFYSPRWLVTLAPGSVLECDGADLRGADRKPSSIKLVRGAMMVQGKGGTLPEGVTLNDLSADTLASPATGTGSETVAPGIREVVTAARGPSDAAVSADVLLARARETMRPVLALPLGGNVMVTSVPPAPGTTGTPPRPRGVAPVTAFTLLCDLPAAPEFITRYVPVHVASSSPVERVAFSMFAQSPTPDAAIGALIQHTGGKTGPVPVALVLPRSLDEHVGPNPKAFGAYLSAQKLDLWALRRQAEESMAKVGLQQDVDTGPSTSRIDATSVMLICGAILVLSVPGVRIRLIGLLEMIPGFARLKCRRCGLVLDQHPIGEFTLEEDHEPLNELLRYDVIMEMIRQDKARIMILDRLKMNTPVPRGKPRFRFSGTWCQRCLGGSILAELVKDGRIIDETDWEVVNADTQKLFRMIKNPALVAELTDRDK